MCQSVSWWCVSSVIERFEVSVLVSELSTDVSS